jgi:hypothetical protein
MTRWNLRAALAALAALAACSDPNELADAALSNVVDTVTVFSFSDGSISQPSAYSVTSRAAVRTWESGINFEFVYDIDDAERPVFIPIELFDLLPEGSFKPGLRRPSAGTTFDQMTRAPLNGYTTNDTIPIAVGDLFFVRTTVSSCSFLGVPLYAKVEVLDFDTAANSVRLKVLADQNCGYRGLRPGIPQS